MAQVVHELNRIVSPWAGVMGPKLVPGRPPATAHLSGGKGGLRSPPLGGLGGHALLCLGCERKGVYLGQW